MTRIEGPAREGSGSGSVPRPGPDVTRAMPSSRPQLDGGAGWHVPNTPPSGVAAPPGWGPPPMHGHPHAAYMPTPSSMPAEKVSSVASAVVPLADRSGPMSGPYPAQSSGGGAARVLVALTALLVLGGGAAYGVRRYTRAHGGAGVPPASTTVQVTKAEASAAPAANAPSAPPETTPAVVPALASAAPPTAAPASAAPSTSSSAPSASTAVRRPRPRPQGSSGTTTAPTSTGVPDDLSNNPYR